MGKEKERKKASTIAPTSLTPDLYSLTPDPSPNGEGSRKYCLLGVYGEVWRGCGRLEGGLQGLASHGFIHY